MAPWNFSTLDFHANHTSYIFHNHILFHKPVCPAREVQALSFCNALLPNQFVFAKWHMARSGWTCPREGGWRLYEALPGILSGSIYSFRCNSWRISFHYLYLRSFFFGIHCVDVVSGLGLVLAAVGQFWGIHSLGRRERKSDYLCQEELQCRTSKILWRWSRSSIILIDPGRLIEGSGISGIPKTEKGSINWSLSPRSTGNLLLGWGNWGEYFGPYACGEGVYGSCTLLFFSEYH